MSREAFAAKPGGPLDGKLILPCGPEHGCDYEGCEGWAQVRDEPFALRHWTAEEITDAREWARTHETAPPSRS